MASQRATKKPRPGRRAASAPIVMGARDQSAVRAVARLLRHSDVDSPPTSARLVTVDGEQVDIPEPLLLLLRQATNYLTRGEALMLVPVEREVTTQQAAALLNVSRPYVVSLLDRGEIPYTRTVGAHRRIQLSALQAYKAHRDRAREGTLDHLIRLSEDYGLYEDDASARV